MTAPSPSSRIAVLVVEDEPLLLWDAVDLLTEAGFATYSASSADEAIALLEANDDIRILFTDIDMPGSMDGLRLAHAVRERWPPVFIVVVSGQVEVTAEQLPENGVFLAKPYLASAVIGTMNTIADRLGQ